MFLHACFFYLLHTNFDLMQWINDIITSSRDYHVSLLISFIIVALYFTTRALVRKLVHKQARKHDITLDREMYMRKLSSVALLIVAITVIGAIWEISLKGISLYFASALTVVGVALFATWSVLSNLTSSMLIFFFFPYRIGQRIKIIDGDNSVEGTILDINLFHMTIQLDKENAVSYPNNLVMQKPVITKS